MKTSIYFAVDGINIVVYKRRKHQTFVVENFSCPINEGTIINGKITDASELIDRLSELKAKKPKIFKNVSLVIDSNSLITKKIPVPKLKKRQYYQIVKDDLKSTSDSYDDLVFDYSFVVKQGKTPAILACAAEKALLESYLSVFSHANIKLNYISMGLESIINFVKSHSTLKNESFTMNIVDGVSMLSVIFENGNYLLSTRTRLVGEDDLQIASGILQNLSSLIQFGTGQGVTFNKSYYIGINKEQMELMKQLNNNYVNVENFSLPLEGSSNCSHFAYLATYNAGVGINLKESYNNADRNKKNYRPMGAIVYTSVFFFLIITTLFLVPLINSVVTTAKILTIKEYLENEKIVEKIATLDKVSSEISRMMNIISQIESKEKELSYITTFTVEIIDKITTTNSDTIDVTDIAYDMLNNIIKITGNSTNEIDCSEYVKELKKFDFVSDIHYTGYKFDKDKNLVFTLDVILIKSGEEAAYE